MDRMGVKLWCGASPLTGRPPAAGVGRWIPAENRFEVLPVWEEDPWEGKMPRRGQRCQLQPMTRFAAAGVSLAQLGGPGNSKLSIMLKTVCTLGESASHLMT
jgi:hypothetical protein